MSTQLLHQSTAQSVWIIIDANVADSKILVDGAIDGTKAFILEPKRDGIEQITELLQATGSPPQSLHIVSHGSPGTLYLGNSELSLSNLNSYAQQLAAWNISDLIFYGCNVAAGDAGEEFLTQLHHLTGANLAASNNKVGHVSLGGHWNLDVEIGPVDSSVAFTTETIRDYPNVFMFVDLSDWEQQGNLANGDWEVSGSEQEIVTQSENGDPTYYVSPSNFVNGTVTGSFEVTTAGNDDNDFIGFVFGYQSPVSDLGDETDDFDFYLFDWKQERQVNDTDFGDTTADGREGFSLSRVQASSDNTLIEDGVFWSHESTTGFTRLDEQYGSEEGWEDETEYEFELVYNEDQVRISIDGEVIFDITGSFEAGRFGFYNYSQPGVEYSEFESTGAPPTAVADTYTITPNSGSASFDTPGEGVLANDSNGTLNPLSALLVSSTSNGILNLNEDGSFEYSPDTGFVGQDSFTYEATDGTNTSSPVTVTLTVVNDSNIPGAPGAPADPSTPSSGPLVFQFKQFVRFEELDEGRPYQGNNAAFDEEIYLLANPDVRAAVENGDFSSGLQHYNLFGTNEGRSRLPLDLEIGGLRMSSLFDETYYLDENPDVAAAVANGDFTYGYEHFLKFGIEEDRSPSYYYDEDLYLSTYSDVEAAVANGTFSSGLEHYLLFGHIENRIASELFDPNDYLTNNLDVAAAVSGGGFSSGFDHYLEWGASEGRISTLLYEEASYLSENSDVAAAVSAGDFQSGFDHYVVFGQREERDPTSLFDENSYLDSNSDVTVARNGGILSSGMEHFFRHGRGEGRAAVATI